jgi:hypothetical protein
LEARCEGLGLYADVVGEREEKGGVETSSTMVWGYMGGSKPEIIGRNI